MHKILIYLFQIHQCTYVLKMWNWKGDNFMKLEKLNFQVKKQIYGQECEKFQHFLISFAGKDRLGAIEL